MAGICFYFEENDVDVWSGRDIDFDAWNYAIKAAGDITDVIVINKTTKELQTLDASLNFSVVQELPQLTGNIATICCPWNTDNGVSLWEFDHTGVDWYLFGPAAGWNPNVNGGVYVPQNGYGALHSTHIASIVLLHRYGALNGYNVGR